MSENVERCPGCGSGRTRHGVFFDCGSLWLGKDCIGQTVECQLRAQLTAAQEESAMWRRRTEQAEGERSGLVGEIDRQRGEIAVLTGERRNLAAQLDQVDGILDAHKVPNRPYRSWRIDSLQLKREQAETQRDAAMAALRKVREAIGAMFQDVDPTERALLGAIEAALAQQPASHERSHQ